MADATEVKSTRPLHVVTVACALITWPVFYSRSVGRLLRPDIWSQQSL